MIDGRRGRLLQDARDLEAGELAGFARRLDLRRIEVCRHGDHGAIDPHLDPRARLSAQLLEHALAQLDEDAGADLFGRERVRPDLDLSLAAHLALDRLDGPRILATAIARGAAHHDLFALGIPADRRRHGAAPEAIGVDEDVL